MNRIKCFRQGLTAFLIAIFLLTAAVVGAAVEIFDGAGQYIMSDFENHDIAKQRAQQRAERDAQKKAGVALKTFSRSINSELSDDEISAITNNIIKVSEVKIVPVPFEAEGEAGLMYRATLKATIDTNGIYAWIKRDDKEKVTILNQNKELQDAIAKNDKRVEDLKEKYNRATSQAEKNEIREQMTDADRKFLANQKFEEGLKLYYAQDYDEAINVFNETLNDFTKIIMRNPNDYSVYYNRGLSYEYIGMCYDWKIFAAIPKDRNLIEGINYCDDSVIYIYDDPIYGVLIIIVSFEAMEQYKLAIQDYDKAIELNPNFAKAYNNRGKCYFALDKKLKSKSDFDKAIQINPYYTEAYSNREQVYFALGEIEKSKSDSEKAKELRYKR